MTYVTYKALTLPVQEFHNTKKEKTVIDGKCDVLLLFLCSSEIAENDLPVVDNASPCVYLYLHVLSNGYSDKFSVPYKLLKFETALFVNDVVNNNCILPKRYISSNCVKDFISETLSVQVKSKSKFSSLYVKSYSDFNIFFNNLYRNVQFKPFKMFLLAYFYFKYGMKVSLYVLSDIFDKFYMDTEKTNPKENFHLLKYMINRYTKVPLTDMNASVIKFSRIVDAFTQRSLETYEQLNKLSKSYTHEDTGGLVCSYAMTKSFHNITAKEYLDPKCVEKHDQILKTFKDVIIYYDKSKFNQINEEVSKCTHTSIVSSNEITRYILKRSDCEMFGLSIKKSELKHKISTALLKYYGTFPPPHMELQATTLLCEMMAGAFDDHYQFASTLILNIKPFKPILTKWKERDYFIMTLNSFAIDKPIPKRVTEAIKKHLKNPNIESYMNYCFELLNHISLSDNYYHETINPFLPIYTINADIDIYDKHYIKAFYENENQWDIKEELFQSLKQLVLYVCKQVLNLPVSEDNTIFYMYESIRDDLCNIDKAKFKLGVRLIIKFTTVSFMNREIVAAFLNILNVYRCRFDHLRHIQDENIFDKAVYGQTAHEIRLPMNMKPDSSKALIPVFFKCHSLTFLDALYMTSALVHCRNNGDTNAKIHYIYDIHLPNEDLAEKFDNSSVYKDMFFVKSNKKEQTKDQSFDIFKSFKFTERHKAILIDAIDRYSCGRLKSRKNVKILKILQNKPLSYQSRNKFSWCSKLKFCAITQHMKPENNPCNYYVRLKSKTNGMHECFIYCYCYGSKCRESIRRHCICKCLL